MGTTIHLPKRAMTEYDLPRVCVATGATDGVSFKKVTFQFTPLWARLSVAFCGILGVVLMLVNTKRVEADVPFTDAAFAKYKRDKLVPGLLVVGGLVPLFAGLVFGAEEPSVLLVGFGLFFALLIGAVVYVQTVTRESSPICKGITEQEVTLELPSHDAAMAFVERTGGRLD
jgi:hypothetical protein